LDNFATKSLNLLSWPASVAQFALRALVFLLLAGVIAGVAAGSDRSESVALSGSGLTFAVADFDGDLRPDLAIVEVGRNDFFKTDYWIHLQLSAARGQTILVVAPAGGLQITARDVNGDHALDLVLTTRWLKQPVAILLNDGHGVFSRADSSSFPEAFGGSNTNWNLTDDGVKGALGAPPQQRGGISLETARLACSRSQLGRVSLFCLGFPRNVSIFAPQGRAPPFPLS